jgi:hypothetical protein
MVKSIMGIIQGGPDSVRQYVIINNQSIQHHTGKWESTFCLVINDHILPNWVWPTL